MNRIILDGPAVEPVSLSEMRLFLRRDASDEDDLVTALIVAARVTVEAATRLALIRQTWRLRVPVPSCGGAPTGRRVPTGWRAVPLPLAPVLALAAVRPVGGPDLAAGHYRLDVAADPARLVFGEAAPDLGAGLEIDLAVGFGPDAASVPEPLRLAIRILAACLYARRGDERGSDEPLPASVRALLAPFARARLA